MYVAVPHVSAKKPEALLEYILYARMEMLNVPHHSRMLKKNVAALLLKIQCYFRRDFVNFSSCLSGIEAIH